MNQPRRRQVLASCLGGVAGLAGCQNRSGIPAPDCTDEKLVHESDVPLTQSTSWPSFQYDAANTGYNPTARGPKDGVDVAWRYPTCLEAESGVVIHDDAVAAGGLVVDGRSGRRVGGEWDSHASTPTFALGHLFVGAHDLLARDPTTGEINWTFETDSDRDGLGPPAVMDGTVYVTGQFDDPTVYAVDAVMGNELWRSEHDATFNPPLAVGNATVFAVDERSTVHALDARNGDDLWHRPMAADVAYSTPVFASGVLYLASNDGIVVALDAETGSAVWRRELGSEPLGPLAVADGTVFLLGLEATLHALSAATGRDIWTRSISSDRSGTVAVASDVVYVSADGTVYAVDASTGDRHWQFEARDVNFGDYTSGDVNHGIAVVDEVVYLTTEPGDIYALT